MTLTQAEVPAGIILAMGVGTPLSNGACLGIFSAQPPVQPSSQPQLTMSAATGTYCLEVGLAQKDSLGFVVAAPATLEVPYTVMVAHT